MTPLAETVKYVRMKVAQIKSEIKPTSFTMFLMSRFASWRSSGFLLFRSSANLCRGIRKSFNQPDSLPTDAAGRSKIIISHKQQQKNTESTSKPNPWINCCQHKLNTVCVVYIKDKPKSCSWTNCTIFLCYILVQYISINLVFLIHF